MTDITLRHYHPADWDRLCDIHDTARLDELTLAGCPAAFLSLEQTADSEGLFDGELIVAELDGVVRGFVSFTLDQLGWIYSDPARYRSGVGRALLRYAVANAGPWLELEVLEGNTPAIELYLSEGFTIVEKKAGSLEGNETFKVTGLIMQRRR